MNLMHYLFFAATFCLASVLFAQTLDSPQVLSRQVIYMGDRQLIFERIVPPVLPTPQSESRTVPVTVVPRQALSVSCTVFGQTFTEMRWRDAVGGEYVVWSNLNFTPFTGRSVGGFDLGGVHYEVMMGLGQASAAEAGAPLAAFQAIVPPTEPGPWYAVLQQPETASPDAFQGINALHLWFAANRAAIVTEHEAVKAANEARKAYEAAHPPVKQDTLIRFWPVQSSLHGTQNSANTNSSGEGQP